MRRLYQDLVSFGSGLVASGSAWFENTQYPGIFLVFILSALAMLCGLSGFSYIHSKEKLDDIVERALRNASIWDEVKDRLKKSALGLSGGQQQRLCIARALAVGPKVLLMDEPTSALDPISTSRIEELTLQLKKDYTIIMVTHNMQQAVRISDYTAFFLLGDLIEFDSTEKLFSQPSEKKTEDYITGRFG